MVGAMVVRSIAWSTAIFPSAISPVARTATGWKTIRPEPAFARSEEGELAPERIGNRRRKLAVFEARNRRAKQADRGMRRGIEE